MNKHQTLPGNSESRNTMPLKRSTFAAPRFTRTALAATILGAAAILSGCGTNPDRMNTGSIPDDYRTAGCRTGRAKVGPQSRIGSDAASRGLH